MHRNGKPGWLLAVAGPDGAGKTTFCRVLASTMQERGIRTRVVWLRSFNLLSLGVYAVLRAAGLSHRQTLGSTSIVNIDVKHHPVIHTLLTVCAATDYRVGYFLKATIPRWLIGTNIVGDRCAWDLVVDLSVLTQEPFNDTPAGRLLRGIALKHPTIILTATAETLARRRPIVSADPKFMQRLEWYETLARTEKIPIFETEDGTESALRCALRLLGERDEES